MSGKILMIEDNEQDQKIILRFLKRAGYDSVEVVDNGEDGVTKALESKPEVVLIDTVLPGINGFETCQRISQHEEVTAKIIMMTGRIDAVDADLAKEMGADDYCVKTSDFSGLIESLNNITQAGQGQRAGQPTPPPLPSQARGDSAALGDTWGIEKTNEGIRLLYRELEKKTNELKELDRLKSEFVATVSHELRTPLTLITASIDQVLDGIYGDITDLQREKLSVALRGAKLLRRIIDDLLDISRLEAREIKLNKDVINLTALVKDVCESFQNVIQEKGLLLRMKLNRDRITAVCDQDRVQQVLTNLIGNAMKFTDKGHIEVEVDETEQEVVCRVTDTGIGIAEEHLEKIFDRFQQFGKSYRPGQEGTGLGLSITKSLVELHKGKIFVESKEGQGSQFTFTLPKS